MRAHLILSVLIVGLAAPAWGGDRAVPRGSGGSHSSGAVSRQPSPSGGGHSSGSSSYRPQTGAQARQPRPGGHGGYYGHGGYHGHGGYYGHRYPYYGGYYGYPYYYGYYGYPYWGFGFGWYDGYYSTPYYPYRDYDTFGSLRVIVEPEKTRVYVDGYYAGVADDFDGMFQHLDVAPGRHEISLKLEGYVTHRIKVYVPSDTKVKVRYEMVKGEGPDTVEDLIGDADRRAEAGQEEPRYDPERDYAERYERSRPSRESRDEEQVPPPAALRLRVAPEDASIYIDGRFRGTGRQLDELLLPPGRHKLEVVRPGYRTHESEFEVSEGKPTDLEVSLDKL